MAGAAAAQLEQAQHGERSGNHYPKRHQPGFFAQQIVADGEQQEPGGNAEVPPGEPLRGEPVIAVSARANNSLPFPAYTMNNSNKNQCRREPVGSARARALSAAPNRVNTLEST